VDSLFTGIVLGPALRQRAESIATQAYMQQLTLPLDSTRSTQVRHILDQLDFDLRSLLTSPADRERFDQNTHRTPAGH
jgi:hypothetical protein